MYERFRAERALLHPLWVGALLVLVVNDHWLKGSGLLPSALTGKLSDVAGLIVAPAVLAALLRLGSRRGLAIAHIAVGLGFLGVNVWPAAAQLVESIAAATPLPWAITVDPTDLFALPALAVSFFVLVPAMARGRASYTLARGVAWTAGLLACMATSPPPEPGPPIPIGTNFLPIIADIMVANDTEATRVVRVRSLLATVSLDCAAVQGDPRGTLSRELFGPATVWQLPPGRAFPVRGTNGASLLPAGPCPAFLVDGPEIPMALLFWMSDDYPTRSLPTTTEGADPTRTIYIRADASDAAFGAHMVAYPPPLVNDAPAPAECLAPGSEAGVDWSTPPLGKHVLTAIGTSPDGCSALDFEATPRWYLCAPGVTLPFEAGEELTLSEIAFGEDGGPIQGVELRAAESRVRVGRGADLVQLSPGTVHVSVERNECKLYHDECGGLVAPLVVVLDGELLGEQVTLPAGHAIPLPANGGSFHLIRAQEMPVVNTTCVPGTAGQTYLESAVVIFEDNGTGEVE